MGHLPTLRLERGHIDEDYFWSRVDRRGPDECWPWLGALDNCGYGRIAKGRHHYRAHRVACVISGMDLTVDQVIDHLCRNRACVNPDHLEPTTVAQNTARGFGPTAFAALARLAGRCLNGHELAVVGLHRQGGTMTCAECGRERVRRYKARKRSDAA